MKKQGETNTEDFGGFVNELSKQFPEVSFAKLSRIAVRVKNHLEKQGKQKSTWSEEDEEKLNNIIVALDRISSKEIEKNYNGDRSANPKYYNELSRWLKSLKPNNWKPSEQNIKDLEWCADLVKDKMGVGFHRLQVFIDEIKKL